MELKIIIRHGKNEAEVTVDSDILSHALVCHKLDLSLWQDRERKWAADFIQASEDEERSQQTVRWLFQELEKIKRHREANKAITKAVTSVTQAPA
jgi:hypothetical protein